MPYSELLENLSGKSRLFAHSELLQNLSGKSRLMPQDKLIQDNLYTDLNKQIYSWQKLLQPSLDIFQSSRQLK
ncbi:MAG: hypothetical protein V7L20_12490 [Nostoc sp.]|uniref:hypothetical protein n=1 Tax=Nostoc sp. TaxID=1180 RepID=UPI002FF50082